VSQTTDPRSMRLAGMRRMIAEKMQASLCDGAQLSYHPNLDASPLVAAWRGWREAGAAVGCEDLMMRVRRPVWPGNRRSTPSPMTTKRAILRWCT